jgi:3-oxoadipate enol-lactonase
MACAGLFQARVKGLALIDTTAWYGPQAPEQWRARAAEARAKGLNALVDFQVARWFGDPFRRDHPAVVARTAQVFVANDVDCYAASCALLGDADLRAYLQNVQVPVSIIVGEDDRATPPEMARALHDAIPQSTLAVLPGARHLTPLECPDQVSAELLTLLRRS